MTIGLGTLTEYDMCLKISTYDTLVAVEINSYYFLKQHCSADQYNGEAMWPVIYDHKFYVLLIWESAACSCRILIFGFPTLCVFVFSDVWLQTN